MRYTIFAFVTAVAMLGSLRLPSDRSAGGPVRALTDRATVAVTFRIDNVLLYDAILGTGKEDIEQRIADSLRLELDSTFRFVDWTTDTLGAAGRVDFRMYEVRSTATSLSAHPVYIAATLDSIPSALSALPHTFGFLFQDWGELDADPGGDADEINALIVGKTLSEVRGKTQFLEKVLGGLALPINVDIERNLPQATLQVSLADLHAAKWPAFRLNVRVIKDDIESSAAINLYTRGARLSSGYLVCDFATVELADYPRLPLTDATIQMLLSGAVLEVESVHMVRYQRSRYTTDPQGIVGDEGS